MPPKKGIPWYDPCLTFGTHAHLIVPEVRLSHLLGLRHSQRRVRLHTTSTLPKVERGPQRGANNTQQTADGSA